jgi:hypothetical protein
MGDAIKLKKRRASWARLDIYGLATLEGDFLQTPKMSSIGCWKVAIAPDCGIESTPFRLA